MARPPNPLRCQRCKRGARLDGRRVCNACADALAWEVGGLVKSPPTKKAHNKDRAARLPHLCERAAAGLPLFEGGDS